MKDIVLEIDFMGQLFPREYTCDGEDMSPPIRLTGVMAPYLAIIVDDHVTPDRWFTHWIIWDIPAGNLIPAHIPREPVLKKPFPAVQGRNDFGRTGYRGPCPPDGETHTYFFSVFGLATRLDAPPGAPRRVVAEAMTGHIIQRGIPVPASYRRR